jgi:alkylated DNA repair dioxygenase AlkB
VGGQLDLFGIPAPRLPEGMAFEEEFLSLDDEAALVAQIESLELHEAQYKGYTARRRVMSYGSQYDFDDNWLLAAPSIPPFLAPLRQRLAAWAGVPAARFTNALIAEYRPGTPLGWHRDVPDYELVAGVSLASHARMRLRPYPPVQPKKEDVINVELPPRSAYILRDVARWGWQHSIAPTPGLRYSITFRTRRDRQAV